MKKKALVCLVVMIAIMAVVIAVSCSNREKKEEIQQETVSGENQSQTESAVEETDLNVNVEMEDVSDEIAEQKEDVVVFDTYAEYIKASPEKQQAFYESFASEEEFFEWYDAKKAVYEAEMAEKMESDNITVTVDGIEIDEDVNDFGNETKTEEVFDEDKIEFEEGVDDWE